MTRISAEPSLSLPQIVFLGWWDFTKVAVRQTILMSAFTSPVLLVFGLSNTLSTYLVLSFIGVVLMTAITTTEESGRIYSGKKEPTSESARTDGGTEQSILELSIPTLTLISIGAFSSLLLVTILVGYAGSLIPQASILGAVLSIWFPTINYQMGNISKRLRVSYTGSAITIRLLQLIGVIDQSTNPDEISRTVNA